MDKHAEVETHVSAITLMIIIIILVAAFALFYAIYRLSGKFGF